MVRQLVSKCRAAQRASSYGRRRLLWAPRGRRRTLASWRKKPPATMHSPRSLACREAMIPPHSSDGIATVSAEYVYAAELSGCICPHTVRHTVTWSGAHGPMGASMALHAAEARDGGAVQVRSGPAALGRGLPKTRVLYACPCGRVLPNVLSSTRAEHWGFIQGARGSTWL